MRIVIDMQGAQTESRFRGIGRYTMAFAQAVVRNRGEHEIVLALSGLFPDTIEPIRAAFVGLLPQENIRVWHAPGPVKEEQPGNESRREIAGLLREAFFASLKPEVIHISSQFEGYVDDAVTSIGRFDTDTPVSVTLHDLIPLLNPDHYLKPHPRYEQYYLRKIEFLKRAAVYLAVSESSRQEGIRGLGRVPGPARCRMGVLRNLTDWQKLPVSNRMSCASPVMCRTTNSSSFTTSANCLSSPLGTKASACRRLRPWPAAPRL
jgi:glycosyltransferase involved in cell wall biosynthesis